MKRSMTLLAVISACLCMATGPAPDDADEPATADANPQVKLSTTLGDIVLELNREKAPLTVENFLGYVNAGFYDGLIFHRVIPNFMIQGGGFDAEMNKKEEGMKPPVKIESDNGLKNLDGTIAMARTRDPNSATSQFFINVQDNANLDYPNPDGHGYTVFGKVIEGMDVVQKIRNTECLKHPKYAGPQAVTPKVPVVITEASVVGGAEKPVAEKVAKEPAPKPAKEGDK